MLVVVGVVAAAVGKRLLDWLSGPRAAGLQIGMSVLIVIVGVFLTVIAVGEMAQIAGARGPRLSLRCRTDLSISVPPHRPTTCRQSR